MQVLKLMENFRKEEVHEAVGNALRLGTLSFDAIKHLLLSRIEGRSRRLDLKLCPPSSESTETGSPVRRRGRGPPRLPAQTGRA